MANAFPCNSTLSLAGPTGALETLTACPAPGHRRRASAVICHPHPLHGGSMHNKVVHMLARTFNELGLRTLRFNFRGVGASAGTYAHGIGETDDLIAVLDWLHAHRPYDQLWLAGFSFGAYVALRAAARYPVAQLISVAPPVNLYDFSALRMPTCPWLVVQGENDEVVPSAAVLAWHAGLEPQPELHRMPGTGHFFHGRLNDLRDALIAALTPGLPPHTGKNAWGNSDQ